MIKRINEAFTTEEHRKLKEKKDKEDLSWHDYILKASGVELGKIGNKTVETKKFKDEV